MNILRKIKLKKYRNSIFLLCFLCAAIPMQAQETDPNADTRSYVKQERREAVYTQSVIMGEQDPETVVQSLSTASGDRFLHRPTFSMESTFGGVLPGLVTNVSNGYISVKPGLSLRGRTPLILVDGIPRTSVNIPASQIESITLIKDAVGLAMLGQSSGNGVVNIKTKRGDRTSLRIDFTAQLAFAQQMNRPEYVGAYDYANMLNQALVNDGARKLYSDRDIALFKSGDRPFTHPDVDWYDQLFRKSAPIQQYNLNMHGGGKTTRYFVDVNVFDQAGFLKQDKDLNSYDTRETFKKYSLRTNVDISLSPNTILKANVYGQMTREITPGVGKMTDFYKDINSTPNSAYPAVNPDGTISGNGIYTDNNLYGQSVRSGYWLYPNSDLNIDMSLEHRFKEKLEGLYLSGTYSYNTSYQEKFDRSMKPQRFSYWKDPEDERPDTRDNYTLLNAGTSQASDSKYSFITRSQYIEAAAGYDFDVNKHSSRTKLVYSYNNYLIMGNKIQMSRNAVSFRTEYDYDKRFLAEFAMSAMSLNQLKPSEAWGVFPAVGLGWNMIKESWFESTPAINTLKLRASFGLNGNDGSGSTYNSLGDNSNYYYTYLKYYNPGSKPSLGGGNVEQSTLVEASMPYITKWEKVKRFNVGVDFEAFDKTLSATVEFFHNNFSDILQVAVAKGNNNLAGLPAPSEHVGEYRQNGVELNIGYKNKFGQVSVFGNANATFYTTKLKANGEIKYPEEYMQRVGSRYGQAFGFVSDGLFQSNEDIQNYLSKTAISDYIPQPGDIKYVDLNGDGVLDNKDVKEIGITKAPRIEYGIYLGAEWKGLALTMQWSGLANVQKSQTSSAFQVNAKKGYGQALVEHKDSWSQDNPNALYPRLSAGVNSYNTRESTYWLKNSSFLRLKNVELSYTLPKKWTSAIRMSGVKVFANAYNLLTITGIKDRDPSMLNMIGSTSTPDIKAYNFGLNIQF